jgi:DNA repair exonuclease SbcCD ATPase subunit
MKLLKLTLINFMGHSFSELDLTIKSALILGQRQGNPMYSNAVGKSSIFRAIEYALFNQCDAKLEKLIRDNTDKAEVILEFSVDGKEYKIHRVRHRKDQTDISLFIKDTSWKDLSSRRPSDTEKDISKLIKLNFASFRSTSHFVQGDMSGLATATPENRKSILKEGLNLGIYPKLEKIAKTKAAELEVKITKAKTLYESYPDLEMNKSELTQKLDLISSMIPALEVQLNALSSDIQRSKDSSRALQLEIDKLSVGRNEAIAKDIVLKHQLDKLITSLTSSQANLKKQQIAKTSLENELSTIQAKLDSLVDETPDSKLVQELEGKLQSLLMKGERQKLVVESLSKPITESSTCPECRQAVSAEYRSKACHELSDSLSAEKERLAALKTEYSSIKAELNKEKLNQERIRSINESNKILRLTAENTKTKIESVAQMIRSLVAEESSLNAQFAEKQSLIKENIKFIDSSDDREILAIRKQIDELSGTIQIGSSALRQVDTELQSARSERSVISHKITEIDKASQTKAELKSIIETLLKEYEPYPDVIKAFSSTGIPNLIVQNILDDLQTDANTMLAKIKPELTLSFSTEKENTKGELVDKLEILYFVDGVERDYSLVSGAMKVAISFALKLGFSHLLQRLMGVNLEFLLIDEVDEALDKAGIDDFAKIIKSLEKECLVLVITHNDRLKDKFSEAIMVEQAADRSSTASLISW